MIPDQAFDEQPAEPFLKHVDERISRLDYRQGDTGQPYLENYLSGLPRDYREQIKIHLKAREFAAADRLARDLKDRVRGGGGHLPAMRRQIAKSAINFAKQLRELDNRAGSRLVMQHVVIASSCGKCGEAFKVSAEDAGKKAMCRKCNAVIVIPSSKAATISCSGLQPGDRRKVAVGNEVTCPNGHRFLAEPRYAGAVRICPTCGEKTLVPKQDSDASMLAVRCPQGHTYEVRANYAGTHRECPTCGQKSFVPAAAADVSGGKQVTCPNGHRFVAESRYAGAFRKCPTCSEKTLVPKDNSGQTIQLECPAGHSYEVASSYAGTYRKCPNCGQKTFVP